MVLLPAVDGPLNLSEEVGDLQINGAEATELRGLVAKLRLVIGRAAALCHDALCTQHREGWQRSIDGEPILREVNAIGLGELQDQFTYAVELLEGLPLAIIAPDAFKDLVEADYVLREPVA